MLNSKLLATAVGSTPEKSTEKIHHDILEVLADAFKEGMFLEFLPEILTISFLGPDPNSPALPISSTTLDETMQITTDHNSSSMAGILFSVSCGLLILKVLLCFAFPKSSRAAFQKVRSLFRSKKHHNELVSLKEEKVLDDGNYDYQKRLMLGNRQPTEEMGRLST